MHKMNQNGAIARLRLPRKRYGIGVNQKNTGAVGDDRGETARITRDLAVDQKLFEASASAGKLNFVAAAGPEAVKAGAHAGKILAEVAAVTGGKGGGRPDSAMSGGRDLDKIEDALKKAEEIVSAL